MLPSIISADNPPTVGLLEILTPAKSWSGGFSQVKIALPLLAVTEKFNTSEGAVVSITS